MDNNSSEDRLVKNEQILRDKNAAAGKGIKKYFRNRAEIKHAQIAFICECSKLDCNEHVNISIDSYEEIHKRKDHFAIFRGHSIPSIEKIVSRHDDFDVVEKFVLNS